MSDLATPIRRFVGSIGATPFVVVRATPPSFVPSSSIETLDAPIPRWAEKIRLSATIALRFRSTTLALPEAFSAVMSARFNVGRNLGILGIPPVDGSGTMEVRPARWTWLPETAGFYHVSADSTFSDGQILRGAIDYTVPIDVTLAAEAAPGAVRITASLRNPIRTNSVPGINPVTSYLFVAQRTDIPGAIPVTRGFGDPASADRTWNTRLPVGLYKLFCVVFQNDANAGVVATGEQIIIDHHVTP